MLNAIQIKQGFERLRSARAPRLAAVVLTLADLHADETARVACVQCAQVARCERLQAYGLAQGQIFTLLQHAPVFVIRVDETELALDAEIARCVQVERQWAPFEP